MKHKKHDRSLKKQIIPLLPEIKKIVKSIFNAALFKIFLIFFGLVVSIGFIVSIIELKNSNTMFNNLFDGIWWSLVTITTVGYGDKFPQTVSGRILAMTLMLTGIGLTTLISGTIASIFVERRIREGKGLQMIKAKNHIIVCGYNKNIKTVLDGLSYNAEKKVIVLINNMESSEYELLQSSLPNCELKFVKGDFTQEKPLNMASIKTAQTCIIIPDFNKETGFSNSDEKTILACLTIRSLAPDLHISACIVKQESKTHLVRAHIDDIILQDEFVSFLITSSSYNTGISEAVTTMLDYRSSHALHEIDFPPELIGKSFQEAVSWFLTHKKSVLIGIVCREKPVTLDDLLSEDSSAIDMFIKRKFEEAKIIVDEEGFQKKVQLAPDPAYIISENDTAFVIGGNA